MKVTVGLHTDFVFVHDESSALMLRRTLILAGLLALLPLKPAQAQQGEQIRLRVLTYNVWGVPWITPLRAERMARIPKAIGELHPDLVALEEVWEEEDAQTLIAGLAQVGLTHVQRHSPEWPNQNGLLIASRYPLSDFQFKRYSQGRHPHLLWHVDYLSGKGVAQVRVETPLGPISFAATHLQASYRSNDYVFVQMSQALEAADELKDRSHPLIFAGDINSAHDGLPSRVLAARGDLTPTDPDSGIDQILFRDGTFVRAEVASVKNVLTEPIDLGSDTMPLSDHPGVLAEIDLVPCQGRCAPASLGDHLQKLETEVLPLVDVEMSSREAKATRDLILSLLLPLAGFALVFWRRRSLGTPCLKSRAAALLLVVAAGWFTYLYSSFGPAHIAGLLEIKGHFAAAAFDRANVAANAVLSRSGS